jgi:hypothetical protein
VGLEDRLIVITMIIPEETMVTVGAAYGEEYLRVRITTIAFLEAAGVGEVVIIMTLGEAEVGEAEVGEAVVIMTPGEAGAGEVAIMTPGEAAKAEDPTGIISVVDTRIGQPIEYAKLKISKMRTPTPILTTCSAHDPAQQQYKISDRCLNCQST